MLILLDMHRKVRIRPTGARNRREKTTTPLIFDVFNYEVSPRFLVLAKESRSLLVQINIIFKRMKNMKLYFELYSNLEMVELLLFSENINILFIITKCTLLFSNRNKSIRRSEASNALIQYYLSLNIIN